MINQSAKRLQTLQGLGMRCAVGSLLALDLNIPRIVMRSITVSGPQKLVYQGTTKTSHTDRRPWHWMTPEPAWVGLYYNLLFKVESYLINQRWFCSLSKVLEAWTDAACLYRQTVTTMYSINLIQRLFASELSLSSSRIWVVDEPVRGWSAWCVFAPSITWNFGRNLSVQIDCDSKNQHLRYCDIRGWNYVNWWLLIRGWWEKSGRLDGWVEDIWIMKALLVRRRSPRSLPHIWNSAIFLACFVWSYFGHTLQHTYYEDWSTRHSSCNLRIAVVHTHQPITEHLSTYPTGNVLLALQFMNPWPRVEPWYCQ